MDDRTLSPPGPRGHRIFAAAYRLGTARFALLLSAALLIGSLSGCSLFVMAGKMIWGDPMLKPAFTQMTGVDLAEEEKTVLVIVSTPEAIRRDMPSLEFDLLDNVVRRLKSHGIKVVDPDDVATYIDDNGGQWSDVSEFARNFETDYIIHIDVETFHYREENSPSMFRGRTHGAIYAYQVQEIDGVKHAFQGFVGDFRVEYPRHHPVSAANRSAVNFQKEFIDFLSEEFGRKFYAYRLGETF